MQKEFDYKILGYIAFVGIIVFCIGSIARQFAPKGIPPPIAGDPSIQSSVASNTPFSAISASDPAVQQAIDAKVPGAVSGAAGSVGYVKGTMTNIIYPKSSSVDMILCFGSGSTSTQVHVPASNFSKIPDVRQYLGHDLLIKGSIQMGLHLPYITTSQPGDIKQIQ